LGTLELVLADGSTAPVAVDALVSLEELALLTFTPAEGSFGTSEFSFTVQDSNGGELTESMLISVLDSGTKEALDELNKISPDLADDPVAVEKLQAFVESGLDNSEIVNLLTNAEQYASILGEDGTLLAEVTEMKKLGLSVESIKNAKESGVDLDKVLNTPKLKSLANELSDGSWSDEEVSLILSRAQNQLATAMSDGTSLENVDLDKYSLLDEDGEKFIDNPDGQGEASGESFNYLVTEDPYLFEFEVNAGEDNNQTLDGIQISKNILWSSAKDLASAPDKYQKFVSQFDLAAYGASEIDDSGVFEWTTGTYNTDNNQPLTDLDGNVITKAGWYDFTRRAPIPTTTAPDELPELVAISDEGGNPIGYIDANAQGNGAQWIYADEDQTQVLGWHVTFTDNMFGDKDPASLKIKDPGVSVKTLPDLTKFVEIQLEGEKQVESFAEDLFAIEESEIIEPPARSSAPSAATASFDSNDASIAAMQLGDGIGAGNGIGPGTTNDTGTSSGSGEGELSQQINSFLQGDGEGIGDAQSQRGQAAEGQGQGVGGEAALGEDQSPKTQRKRGLLLQPLMAETEDTDNSKTSSTLLKNLSEGSLMGNNLLDALALGAGVLYALYAPKALDTGKKGWRSLLQRVRRQTNGGTVVIPEKNVLSVFAMKMPNGGERLMATRVGMGGIEVLAQQDLPADVQVGQPGSDTQVDYGVSQLLAKLEGKRFDLALLGPKLRNQSALIQPLAKESQLLNTQRLIDRLSACSSDDLAALQQWLNKPSTTPPESSPVFDLLNEQQERYGNDLAQEQASMSSLIELSVAMGWSQYGEAA